MTIKWSHPYKAGVKEQYGLISDCGRFAIGKYILHGGAVYRLWDGQTGLDLYPTADKAKQAAEGIKNKPGV